MRMRRIAMLALCASALWPSTVSQAAAPETAKSGPKRMVLVELFTSQGCDMCPEAEKNLGALGEKYAQIAPIAFHVDYFNKPWKDVFSDAIYSQRQMAYNTLYTGPKNPEYGLYYTPMMMVDGAITVNGRDPANQQAAVRQASARAPLVALSATLTHKDGGRSGELAVTVASRSSRVEGRDLLVCAALRDDKVVTEVKSGENANKSLTARYPSRMIKYEFMKLEGKSPATVRLPFEPDAAWPLDSLRLVIFAQDKTTGAIHQAMVMPWKSAAEAKK